MTSKTKLQRAGAFQKGQSGNPAGRPKGAKNKITVELQAYALSYSADALDNLVEIMQDKKIDPKIRVVAAIAILDRGMGKPEISVSRYVEAEVTRIDGGYKNIQSGE